MRGETTLKELAQMANLSVNTVSRALNDRDGVNPETRKFVKELAQKYHYRPNMMARSMRGAQNNLLGTLVGDITDNFFVQLLAGVEEITGEHMPIIIGNTCEDVRKQQEWLELLLSYHCKNIIITPVQEDSSFIKLLQEEKVNFVIADRTIKGADDCNQVSIDIRRDAFRAVEYLIRCGHRRIGIINQLSRVSTETDRTLGYREALQEYHIPENPAYIRLCHDGHEAGKAAFELMSLTEPPTALFLAKDTLAIEAVSALYSMDLCIPDDVSVFLYGCPEWSQALRPRFTCMEREVKDIGRMSARIILDKLNGTGSSRPINIMFESKLLIRDSVKML